MSDEIFAFAKAVGQVESGEEEILSRLCQTAEEELTGRLREGVMPEDCGGAFVIAAAWLALAGLCVSEGTGGVTAWSAGDVSVKSKLSPGEQAAVYRGQAMRLMQPYCEDEGFAFVGVKA